MTLVRVLAPDALDAVLAVDAESFSHPWTRRMYEEELAQADAQVWIASVDAEVVGACAFRIQLGELQIHNVAVRLAWRRVGIGCRLVTHALALAAQAGATVAWLEVRQANAGARALYARLGFREVAVRRGYYADPLDDALVMSAPIQLIGADSST